MPNQTIASYVSILETQLDETIHLIRGGETDRAIAKIEEAKGSLNMISYAAHND
jgi:hypothetical protein